ncbi:MAG: hypothetical protein IJ516_01060 [Phascolarctobacterium sp.]|nr:hypothetical protein [Phascolarctobacterium sp.]
MKSKIILTLAAMTSFLPLQQAFSMPIEHVYVQVIDVTGGTSAPLLNKMGNSMQIVAQQLLLDRDTEAILPAQQEYATLLSDIADRVLTGYYLQSTQLTVDKESELVFQVRPWNTAIRNVQVDLQFSGIEEQTSELLESKLPTLKKQLEDTIKGASVDASDWADGVLRKIVRQQVEEALPEFKVAVDLINEADKTVVQVIVYPVGQLVRNVDYSMRSDAIPNILLMKLKHKYADECNKLRGLPVNYVERQKQEIEEFLLNKLRNEPEIIKYELQPFVNITPDTDMDVEILIDSNKYKIWFEGYGDIGRNEDNLSGKAHFGKFISPKEEFFGEVETVLDDVDWNFGVGYTRYWGKSGWTYVRRIQDGENNYKLEYNLDPKWRLHAEHFAKKNRNEYGVRYRIHEFLSAEYVYGGDEFYLRIIGNL